MRMRVTSKTRWVRLAKLFPYDSEDANKNLMYAQVARLCVLHEDLRLEIAATYNDSFLVSNGRSSVTTNARQGYFMRRSIATLQEFSQAIVSLDGHNDFVVMRTRWGKKHSAAWDEAVAHFKGAKHMLADIRNDIGGHFTPKAALFAIELLSKADLRELEGIDPSIGTAEYCSPTVMSGRKDGRVELPLRLHFASHISTAAILKRAPGDENPWVKADRMVKGMWKESLKHAYQAVMSIFSEDLWPRFGT